MLYIRNLHICDVIKKEKNSNCSCIGTINNVYRKIDDQSRYIVMIVINFVTCCKND